MSGLIRAALSAQTAQGAILVWLIGIGLTMRLARAIARRDSPPR